MKAGYGLTVMAEGDLEGLSLTESLQTVRSGAPRGGILPHGLLRAAWRCAKLDRRQPFALVHAFGLHGLVIIAGAVLFGWRRPIVVSVTGLGLMATGDSAIRKFGLRLAGVLARFVDRRGAQWIVENGSDAATLGLVRAMHEGRVTEIAGAGVDLVAFPYRPMPPRTELRMILVARLIQSKGIDLAVEAVRRLRTNGLNVILTVVGERDPDNPRSLDILDIKKMEMAWGVVFLGRRDNVAELLARHHLFILPTRGGEGLPRALLEAAATGRPAIVTHVPGCRDFVIDGENGFLVPPDDVDAIVQAVRRAARADLAAMGREARAKVEGTASLPAVTSTVLQIYALAHTAR